MGNAAAKRYGFGGKELQDENISGSILDWYDVSARNYDPAIGRWMNMDPLADYFQESTPYNYSHNSPLFFTDPTGLAPETIYRNIETNETVEVQDGVDKTLDVSDSAFQEAKFFANEINPSTETININGTDFEATVISAVSDDVADAYENFYDSHNSYDGANVSNLMDYVFGGPDLFRESDLVQSGGGALDLIGGKKAIGSTAKALGLTARGVQKHHIIPKAIFKRFEKQLAPFMKLNAGVNLKKLPAPFHGNHPQYNKYVGNRIQALGRNGNINEGSLRALQKDLNSVLNKAYDSGQKLNDYFRQFN